MFSAENAGIPALQACGHGCDAPLAAGTILLWVLINGGPGLRMWVGQCRCTKVQEWQDAGQRHAATLLYGIKQIKSDKTEQATEAEGMDTPAVRLCIDSATTLCIRQPPWRYMAAHHPWSALTAAGSICCFRCCVCRCCCLCCRCLLWLTERDKLVFLPGCCWGLQ